MALDAEQTELYVFILNIWRESDTPPVGTDFGHYSLLKTGALMYIEATPETDETTPIGRNKTVNIFTLDKFHADISEDIRDTDYVTLTGIVGGYAHPWVGKWWALNGNGRQIYYLANKQIVYGKQSEAPAGAA